MKQLLRSIILPLLCFASFLESQAQPPDTLWTRSFLPCTENNSAIAIDTMPGGGFVVAGVKGGVSSGYLQRITNAGDTLWTRFLRDRGVRMIIDIMTTSAGDILFVGNGILQSEQLLTVVAGRFDSSGQEIWIRHYSEFSESYGINAVHSICSTHENTLLVNASADFANIFLLKIDQNGEPTWWNEYSWHGSEYLNEIISVDDGYIGVGTKYLDSWRSSYHIVKFGMNYDTLWTNTYAESFGSICTGITVADAGDIYVVGHTYPDTTEVNSDVVIVKTSPNGTRLWERPLGGPSIDSGYDIQVDSVDNVYFCGAIRNTDNGFRNAYLACYTSEGDSLWTGIYGGESSHEYANAFRVLPNGGYIFCGSQGFTPQCSTYTDWIVLLDSGTSVEDPATVMPTTTALLRCYPNPFNITTTISFDIAHRSYVKLRILDLLGRQVSTLIDDYLNAGRHQVMFDGSRLASGTYFYELYTKNKIETYSMILIK
jgi:hypothetical protein